MREFKRGRCVDNIVRETKEQDKKLGDVEKGADLGVGQLSRLKADEQKGNFNVENFYKIAEQLGHTMDYLANYDEHSPLTDNDKYMIRFLDKLTFQTSSHDLTWKMMEPRITDRHYIFKHPLFTEREEEGENPYTGEPVFSNAMVFDSRFADDADIDGHCFHALVDEQSQTSLYVMSAHYWIAAKKPEERSTHANNILEFYFIDRQGHITELASSYYVCDEVKAAKRVLYEAIENERSQLNFTNRSINSIDRFMTSGSVSKGKGGEAND